jgi:hypothetical protein
LPLLLDGVNNHDEACPITILPIAGGRDRSPVRLIGWPVAM